MDLGILWKGFGCRKGRAARWIHGDVVGYVWESSLTNNECSRASLCLIQHDCYPIPKRNDRVLAVHNTVSAPGSRVLEGKKSNSSAEFEHGSAIYCMLSTSSCNNERTMIVCSSPFLLGHLAMKVSRKRGGGGFGKIQKSARPRHSSPLCMLISA